jgi:hypothetical protein
MLSADYADDTDKQKTSEERVHALMAAQLLCYIIPYL